MQVPFATWAGAVAKYLVTELEFLTVLGLVKHNKHVPDEGAGEVHTYSMPLQRWRAAAQR